VSTLQANGPFHTDHPGFRHEGAKAMACDLASWVGGMQPQGHVQILTNLIDFGMGVQEAGDASRWQHEGDSEPTGEKLTDKGGYVEVGNRRATETVRELKKKGHDVRFDVGGLPAAIKRSRWSCMMGNASMSVRVKAAKTGRQQDIRTA
jgi:gamma-glutamyltranspeptidase